MKRFLAGIGFALCAAAAAAAAVVSCGWAPVSADEHPGTIETRVMSFALQSAVRRHAADLPPLAPASSEDLANGREIFREMCARCHDASQGSAFYPPAPRLAGVDSSWSDRELFWIVKHGIRNTGMPAWGSSLSDDDIRAVVAVLKR